MSTGLSRQRGPGPWFLLQGEVHICTVRAPDVRRACRALLLELLGRCTGVPSDQVRLGRGERGKPEMLHGSIQFNVSHSGGMGLIALAADMAVGVDVEEIRADIRVDLLVRSFFVRESPGDLAAFYSCWTRKEAQIKARGGSVVEKDAGGPGQWHVQNLPVGEGYAAALCCERSPGRVYFWDWE